MSEHKGPPTIDSEVALELDRILIPHVNGNNLCIMIEGTDQPFAVCFTNQTALDTYFKAISNNLKGSKYDVFSTDKVQEFIRACLAEQIRVMINPVSVSPHHTRWNEAILDGDILKFVLSDRKEKTEQEIQELQELASRMKETALLYPYDPDTLDDGKVVDENCEQKFTFRDIPLTIILSYNVSHDLKIWSLSIMRSDRQKITDGLAIGIAQFFLLPKDGPVVTIPTVMDYMKQYGQRIE